MTATTLDGPGRPPARLALGVCGLAGLRVRQACHELGLDCLGPVTGDEAPEALVARAREQRCSALHPGEAGTERQLALARACRAAGLPFVGPRVALIEAMQDGQAMRALLREAGVPLADDRAPPGRRVELSVLADRLGRLRWLAVREALHPGLMRAPVAWLTPERRAYLGQLAVQGLAGLELVGLVTLGFELQDNRLGFVDMRPGLGGWEGLDEALTGLDPVVAQLQLAAGDRLRDRQSALAPLGHALQWRCFPPAPAIFSGGSGLRLDHSPETGGEGRLLAWGRRPEEALRRGRRGLEELCGREQAAALMAGLSPG
jgi:pyruvate carboxylase subunit A